MEINLNIKSESMLNKLNFRSMKKIIFGLIATVFISVSSFGQGKEDIIKLIEVIEQDVQRINFEKYQFDKTLKNKIFFDKVEQIKSKEKITKEDEEELKIISKRINSNSIDIKKEKELILESYLKIISQNKKYKVQITDFYLKSISSSKINAKIKNEIVNDLSFVKDLDIYLDASNGNNVALGRSCLDQCMYDKLAALERANWIEKVAFVLTAAETTAIWVASCAWDCATKK